MLYHKNNFNNEIPSKSLNDFRNSINELVRSIEESTGIIINTKESVIYESVENRYSPEYFDIDVPSGKISEINKSICRAGYKLIFESKSNDDTSYEARFAKDGKNGTIYIVSFFESSYDYDDNDSEAYIEAVCFNNTKAVRDSLIDSNTGLLNEGIVKAANKVVSNVSKDLFENGNKAIKYMRRYRTGRKNVPEDFRKIAVSLGSAFSKLFVVANDKTPKFFQNKTRIERYIEKIKRKKIKNFYSFKQLINSSLYKDERTDNKLKGVFTSNGFSTSNLGKHFFIKNGQKGIFYFGQYAYTTEVTTVTIGNVTTYITNYYVNIYVYCIDDIGDIKSYAATGKLINGDRNMLFAAKRPKTV